MVLVIEKMSDFKNDLLMTLKHGLLVRSAQGGVKIKHKLICGLECESCKLVFF